MKQITALLYLLKSIFQTFCVYIQSCIRKLYTLLALICSRYNTRDVHVQCHYILYMYMYNA